VRGGLFQLHAPRGSRGDEQSGSRFAVVFASDQNNWDAAQYGVLDL
jgi:mRNA interferase MazF